jgi:hypothetical protein
MAFRIKVQRDYFVTEVSAEMPHDVAEADELIRSMRANGKMIVQYGQGAIHGINVEQRTLIPTALASEFRKKLGIGETIIPGK